MKNFLIVVAMAAVLYSCGKSEKVASDESGCSYYASKFSCEYVINKASYDVYYWRYLNSDNSERYVDTVTGLINCHDAAISAHNEANHRMNQDLEWSDRMYICMLKKDGRNLEKHRYIGWPSK